MCWGWNLVRKERELPCRSLSSAHVLKFCNVFNYFPWSSGFRRKEFRGKLAIAITANFINRNTTAEAKVEEISGVAFIFNQKFFQDLKEETGGSFLPLVTAPPPRHPTTK